jgi:hypothetical protein
MQLKPEVNGASEPGFFMRKGKAKGPGFQNLALWPFGLIQKK